MRVFAIETSCDETAAAVVEGVGYRVSGIGTTPNVAVLSNVVASQADLHARTQGVVPEVAARAHVEAVTFVMDDALRQAGGRRHPPTRDEVPCGNPRQEAGGNIDAVAVTTEPGLRPALVVGEAAARALAVAWDKPLIPVNHLAGHIAAAWLPLETGERFATHRFPAIALVVSGGHTQLWKIQLRASAIMNGSASKKGKNLTDGEWTGPFVLTLLGSTRDDAAGEAFDKIARLLGIPYPGGAALASLAEKGDACEFTFPRPMIDSPDLNFSFSGLKTAVYYTVRNLPATSYKLQADIAASAQEAIVDVLVEKTVRAAAQEGAREVILTGGVAANIRLRSRLQDAVGSFPLIVPDPVYCTDNAAMIGAAAVVGLKI